MKEIYYKTRKDSENMKKIVIITCFFGKKPSDFDMWLKSCKNNPSIDWLIFTDMEIKEYEIIKNVTFIKTTLKKIKSLIEKKLKMKVVLEKAYKLCDYKPLYGYIFSNYIKNYDFWGYCDIDMIFGDIRTFLTEKILNEYKKIYSLGHLSLYKNELENNKRFMTIKNGVDYRKAFETENIYVFDELLGIFKLYNLNEMYLKNDYADINRFNKKSLILNNADNNIKNHRYQTFLYENSKLYIIFIEKNRIYKKEIIYIHYSGRTFKTINSESFFITTEGFIKYNNENIDLKIIKKLNNRGSIIVEKIITNTRTLYYRLRRKIKKVMTLIKERNNK